MAPCKSLLGRSPSPPQPSSSLPVVLISPWGPVLVLGRLAGPQMADLDGDETRHKILFCDGMLHDFKERVLRSPIPADRMDFHAKATLEMWQREWQTGHRVLRGIGAGRVRDPPPHEGVRGLGLRPLRAASHDQGHLRDAAVLRDGPSFAVR